MFINSIRVIFDSNSVYSLLYDYNSNTQKTIHTLHYKNNMTDNIMINQIPCGRRQVELQAFLFTKGMQSRLVSHRSKRDRNDF